MKLTKKVKLYVKLAEVIDAAANEIYKEKQRIPWSGTNVGATFAVTTGCVSYNLGKMEHEIRDLLRGVKIK